MPLICAKSLRNQNHNRTGDESEKLDRSTQFETGLTGTPYATCRNSYRSDLKTESGKKWVWQLLNQIRLTNWIRRIDRYTAEKAVQFSGFNHSNLIRRSQVQI
jgi:hypothetical protein